MTDTELLSIGVFAQRAALTASALRFYDDAGLLRPAQVDPVTGYRLYAEAQVEQAVRLRQLRAIGMPLQTIAAVFAAGTDEAVELIDRQVERVTREASEVQQLARALTASLRDELRLDLGRVPGPAFASAIDQILPATVDDRDNPVLGGVHLDIDLDAVTLTATDRYRLATRTLAPLDACAASWSGTLAGDDVRKAVSRLRRSHAVRLEASDDFLGFDLDDGTVAQCSLMTEQFPDHRTVIASLPGVTNRVIVETAPTLKELERAPESIEFQIADGQPKLVVNESIVDLSGTATGGDLRVSFELTTLYPALSHALGTEVMIDLRGSDQPATVRSADDGDLTQLVMPCRTEPVRGGHYSPTTKKREEIA